MAATRGGLWIVGGAVVTSVGIGLSPYIAKQGVCLGSLVAVVALAAGLVIVVRGALIALRGRRRWTIAGGVVATVVTLAVIASVVAPAIAATNVPGTSITVRPADVGLTSTSVTFTTADGVVLAGWYVPGTNGAGVVVLHGAGSTRSSALDQAAVLAGGGYAVLLVDARGHGESGGQAMDFGWYGDADIAAATAFLAAQPGVDADRIGAVGFSMGGEEAIGAAAGDPRLRAVVAEGATGRTAADKGWLSDTYGWRGWAQEQLERLQYSLTDLISDASSPGSLRSAVAGSGDTRFLLITAGEVADEAHAAAFIREGAADRVEVWTVEGADHTGGYRTAPAEWSANVLSFLDDALAG